MSLIICCADFHLPRGWSGLADMAGSFDHTAKVWDAATRRELLTLKGHSDTVSGVAFSSDGKRLATGSWDDTAKLWLSEAPEAEAMVEQGVRP